MKRLRRLIRITVLSLAIMIGSTFISALNPVVAHATAKEGKPVIMLDMAHHDSQYDNGASWAGVNEREIVNQITERVAYHLACKDYSVTLTRQYEETITIGGRIRKANATDYDYFVSIHANASESHNGHGVEGYYNGDAAEMLSKIITSKLSERFSMSNRGNKKTPYYTNKITNSALMEIGFIDNDRDREIMLNNKEEIAKLIADGIDEAYKLSLSQC